MAFRELMLAIDTSSGCSLGLLTPLGETFWVSHAERQSAHEILPQIEKMLRAEKIYVQELNAIAVATGPGSFTGLRIGVSVEQAFGFAHDIPIIAISNLALLAYGASARHEKVEFNEMFLVAEEARGQEIYFGCYKNSPDGGIVAVEPEVVVSLDEVAYPIKPGVKNCFVGDPWFTGSGKENVSPGASKVRSEIESRSIKHLLDLGRLRFLAGTVISAGELMPNYVKEDLDYV